MICGIGQWIVMPTCAVDLSEFMVKVMFFHTPRILHTLAQAHTGELDPHRLVGLVDPVQKQRLSDEEADAEVLVNGVAIALKPSEEAEGEDADKQANQWQQDAHPRDDIQEHVMHAVCFLWNVQTERQV